MFAHEGLGFAGQIEADDLSRFGIEGPGDGRAEVTGAAGDPD